MKTYRSEQHNFEIDIPESWSFHSDESIKHPLGSNHSLVFKCSSNQAFNIQIRPLRPSPAPQEIENKTRRYIQEKGYTSVALGRVMIGGKEHIWARYYVGGGLWSKKYLIVLNETEYAITATCLDQTYLLEMEKGWDATAASFRFTVPFIDLDKIMQTLAMPARPGEIPARIQLCQQALVHVNRQTDPETWAGLELEFAKNFAQNPQGDQLQNIELAILHNEKALEVFTRSSYPEYWANIHSNLASNYRRRLWGERAENLEEALRHCQQALDVLDRMSSALLWAGTHNNMANIYRDRLLGERVENIEQAIHHCQQTLEVFTRTAYPFQWATVQNNLGNAFQDRIRGEKESNIEQAIACYQQAFDVFTRNTYPVDWAWTHCNLSSAYRNRIRGERSENIEMSIQHAMQALEVFSRESLPEKWALAHRNLGSAYLIRRAGEKDANEKQAITHLELAMSVYSQQTHPEEWAQTQQGLALLNQQQDSSATTAQSSARKQLLGLTYPELYDVSLSLHPDKKYHLRLIYSDVPDEKYSTNLLMVYHWDGDLSDEEADILRLRTAVYLSCAIFDVARSVSVPCDVCPVRNGQRPTWVIAGEGSPVSVTLSEYDTSDRTLQMSLGPIVVAMQHLPKDKTSLKKLMEGFRDMYREIDV